MKILLASLQYSPIYKSHCKALGDQCQERGDVVHYLLNRNYEWMLPQSIKARTTFVADAVGIWSSVVDGASVEIERVLGNEISSIRPDYVYMFNLHPFLNRKLARLAKGSGAVTIQHVHEPYVERKRLYGGFTQFWLPMFEGLQNRTLDYVDTVVLSSARASSLFDKRYPDFRGKKLLIPLMYEDLGNADPPDVSERKYVTLIGPPSKAKGTGIFESIVRFANREQRGYRFLIVSGRGPVDRRLAELPNLDLVSGVRLSDADIGRALRQSIATLTPYTVATQSSVIPVSYMYRTPVVSSNVGGLPEEVEHSRTGYLVNADAPPTEWVEALDRVRKELPEMSAASRKLFEERFSGANWPRYFDALWAS